MNKVIVLNEKKDFLRKIYILRLLSFMHISVVVNYKGKLYTNSKEKHPKIIDEIVKMLDILNAKKRTEKYSIIYDYACDYLDNEFSCHKWCDFKNNMCISNRNKIKEYQVSSCCTRNTTRITCKHFNDDIKRCGIKCLPCKLFVCNYLYRKGIRYHLNDVIYLKYFLSLRQKSIAKFTFFQPKEVIIKKWLRFYKLR